MSYISMKQLLEAGVQFRTPDKKMEPEDEKVHLHRKKRDLHHRLTARQSVLSTTLATSLRKLQWTEEKSFSLEPKNRLRKLSKQKQKAAVLTTSHRDGWAAHSQTSKQSQRESKDFTNFMKWKKTELSTFFPKKKL